jgi:hypothetical protein
MKRGFTQTLMMSAILVMAAQAMAMAPIIGDIPSPVVGDQDTATPANTFVYPDAINLTNCVTDETTASQIVWSYKVAGSQIYSINGDQALLSSQDGITPNSNQIIAGPGAIDGDPGTTTSQDSLANTITIRNIVLSPLGGAHRQPNAGEIASSMPQAVTLYASDGDTVGTKTVMFWTSPGVKSHMSYPGIPVSGRNTVVTSGSTPVANGMNYAAGGYGNMTHAVDPAKGLCLTVGTNAQDNLGAWDSSWGDITLVDNAAYRIRLIVNGTQTAANQVPLWDLVIKNLTYGAGAGDPPVPPNRVAAGYAGLDLYAGDFYLYDNAGGENAAVQLVKGDVTYDFWWTPPPVLAARWKNQAAGTNAPYDPANVDNRNAYFQFRMLDSRVSNAASLHAQSALGNLCLKSFKVDRFDIVNDLVAAAPIYQTDSTYWVDAPAAPTVAPKSFHMETPTNGKVTFTAGTGLTMSALNGNGTIGTGDSADCYLAVAPGDHVGYESGDVMTEANIVDNYPMPFDAQTLYKVTFMLDAPLQTDMDNPPDLIFLMAQSMDNEITLTTYIDSHSNNCAMPAFGAAQPYTLLVFTEFGQSASNQPFWGVRPIISLSNSHTFIGPLPGKTKMGGVRLSGMTIQKITGGIN